MIVQETICGPNFFLYSDENDMTLIFLCISDLLFYFFHNFV